MPPDSNLARRSHALFTRAMELDASQRRAFVESECVEDGEMRKRLLDLLDAADRSESFLSRSVLDLHSEDAHKIPDAVGDYLVVGVLGTGGMATVYEAIQDHPKRRVALKVMHQGMTHSEAYLRFRFETEALARLQHPGIAQIYEAGAAHLGQRDPSPFFAMELVPDALPITRYAQRHALPLRARIAMLASVCDAVHHGHQQGIIHRDLKPANILVDGDGRAKVIDFGVARTTDAGAESLTDAHGVPKIIGTLNYMSPEQCGVPGGIDIRSDVYSLGVVLYELVCARLPCDLKGLSLPAAVEAITRAPPRPLDLAPSRAHRDLQAIIFKAIEKTRDRRYDSAAALAADLRRLLAHEPVEARPPGMIDQCRLFARRHAALVTVGLALLATVVIVAAISTVFAVRLTDEVGRRRVAESDATKERDLARWQAYTAQIAGALSAMNTGEFQQMRTRLAAAAYQPRGWEWGFLSRLSERSAVTINAHDSMIMDMAVSPDWSRFATAAGDGSISLWDARTGARLAACTSPSEARASSIAFTPDARHVITGDTEGVIRIFDAADLRELRTIADMPTEVRSVIALPAGRVAAAMRSSVMVWPLEGGEPVELPESQPDGLRGVALSSSANLLAVYGGEGSVWIRRVADWSVVQRFQFPGYVNQARFSDDERLIGAAGEGGRLLVWNIADGAQVQEFKATGGINTVRSLAFSHDGKLIAAGLVHRGILIVSAEDGRTVGEFGGHTEAVAALSFSPDDQMLVSASWDGSVRTWRTAEARSPGGVTTLEGHQNHVMEVAFAPDGSVIASASRDGTLRMWDPDLGEQVARFSHGPSELTALSFSSDGTLIATGGASDTITIQSAHSGIIAEELVGSARGFAAIAFDPTGRRVAAGGQDGTVHIWNLGSPQAQLVLRGHTARVNSVTFSPDGLSIATGSRDRTVRLWNASTGAQTATLAEHRSDVFAVLFSGDGRRLYSGSRDQTVRVWDVQATRCVATLDGHGQYVTCLALNADETRLAAGSWFGEIVLFDVPTLDQIASFRAHDSAIRGVSFSPDGRWLASASYDATIRLFDAATRQQSDTARDLALNAWSHARRRVVPIPHEVRNNPANLPAHLSAAGVDLAADPWARKAVLSELSQNEGP